jgi:hypothetical protein
MSDNDVDRLATLEAENVALRAELARLRPPPPEQARIDGPFRPPTAQQMERLIAAVFIRYPGLRDRSIDAAEFHKMVTTAFRFLSLLPRTPGRLDLRYDLLSWYGHASEALRTLGQPFVAGKRAAHCGDRRRRYWVSAGKAVSERWVWRVSAWHHERYPPADECLVANPRTSV